jgi:hypothetical protein
VKIPELLQIMRSAEWREIQWMLNNPHIRAQMELAEQIRRMDMGRAGIGIMRSAEWHEIQWILNSPHIRAQMEVAKQIGLMDVGSSGISVAPAP